MTSTHQLGRSSGSRLGRSLYLALLLLSTLQHVAAFAAPQPHLASTTVQTRGGRSVAIINDNKMPSSTTALQMSDKKEGGGGGLVTTMVGVLVALIFLSTSILPMMMATNSNNVAPLSDAVATRQDSSGSFKPTENNQYRLSRSSIQEKVSGIPVFYLVGDEDGEMKTDLYLSYSDATAAAQSGSTVKATTLDQVLYPLVLQRGRMRMEPPPIEVEKAEAKLNDVAGTYRLIPSQQAKEDAVQFKMNLASSDIPLFVADRLAFAGQGGSLQLPLFLEQKDCITSYTRLRASKTSLPEQPNIRSTTLMDELASMEKGTRPGMSQLAFYATAEDVNKAVEMFDGK